MPAFITPRIITAMLTSHRALFALAGTHWAAGFATIPFLGEYAVAILLAAGTLTILAGQQLLARQQAPKAELQESLGTALGAIADYAEISLRGKPSDSGAHQVYRLHAVEDDRTGQAG